MAAPLDIKNNVPIIWNQAQEMVWDEYTHLGFDETKESKSIMMVVSLFYNVDYSYSTSTSRHIVVSVNKIANWSWSGNERSYSSQN